MPGLLRWGFLGSGWIADQVAADFKIAGLNIAAFASESSGRAESLASKYDAKSFNSYQELVESKDIDVIYVNTIHPLHAEHAKLALNNDKHVLVEKPFTMNAREAKEIQSLAQMKNLFVLEAMWTRFLPMHKVIFEQINNDLIGKPFMLLADHSQYLPHIRRLNENKLGGGALLDLGIYPVNFVYRLFGTPTAYSAIANLNDEKIDLSTSMNLKFENGEIASLTTSSKCAGPITATILGDKGRIEIGKSFYEQAEFRIYDNNDQLKFSYDEKINGVGRQFQAIELENCLNQNLTESTILPVSETISIMNLMDKIRQLIDVKYAWTDSN